MNVRIFAKKGTNEKVMLPCANEHARTIMISLGEKYGGTWVPVDQLKPGEVLRFEDGMEYHGFSDKIERYCDKIETVPNIFA